jgi:DNA-directed RNA polymerase subunit RPC12/RpoP
MGQVHLKVRGEPCPHCGGQIGRSNQHRAAGTAYRCPGCGCRWTWLGRLKVIGRHCSVILLHSERWVPLRKENRAPGSGG